MIRTTCDEVVLRRRQRALGIAAALGCLLLAVPALPNSQSAAVVQVRVGKHPTFTRVVFELDGEADYAVRQARDSKEILVELDAGSRRRVMTSRSDLVETVSVQPADGGSLARIRVSQIPVHITEMLLSNPTRIVLDLRSEPEQLAATKPSPTPAPGDPETDGREEPAGGVPDVTPEPAPERKPEPEPEPEPAVVAGGPDVSAGTGGVGGAEDEPPAGQDDPVPSDPTGGEPDLDPWATLDPDLDPVTGDPGIDEPGTSDPEPGLAVTEPGGAAATGDDPLAAGGDLDDPTTPGSAGELPLFSSLPEAVRDPRALVGLGGALVVGVLLAAW
ncbi:MAG: hypothetical protein GWN07_26065, partial [Actinobacteria bacterium]|nr:hypothetical protein [Actinomycetota bacterium]NIX23110.1 hypothetical protein [Actinomycetota bacterium]